MSVELIDRYIYAVTQKLPQAQRKDIADELRGLIEDMVEERVGSRERTKKDVEAVLLELGNPRELANQYRGTKRFLIGPEIFDSYLLVLKIVLISVSAAIGIGFLIQMILDPFSILDYFIDMIVSIVTALPMAFGWTTFGFAVVEYFGGIKEQDLFGKVWKLTDLPSVPDEKRQIKRSESITGIIFHAILLVIFVFSSEYFGLWVFSDGFDGVVPFLNEETYGTYMWLILLVLGFGILKESAKLVKGKWTYPLVTFTTIVNAISMAVILLLVNKLDFWNPTFMSELVEVGILNFGSDAYEVVNKIWEQSTFWIFMILLIGLVWEAINGFLRARKN